MKEILVKLAINAVVLYGLALLCGGRIRFRGLAPVISVALFMAPVNVFVPELNALLGIPDRAIWVFLVSVACNGAILYALAATIPKLTVDSFTVAVAFAALMGVASLFIHYFLADQLAAWL